MSKEIVSKIRCEECGKEFYEITDTHLWYAHRMTMEEYVEKYPEAKLKVESTNINEKEIKEFLSEQLDLKKGVSEFKDKSPINIILTDVCQICGEEDKPLQVHYKNFLTPSLEESNKIEDKIILCKKCHTKLHKELNKTIRKKEGSKDIEKGMYQIFKGLEKFGLNLKDENFTDTPKRVSRAYTEIFSGINAHEEIEEILGTSFPSDYDGMVIAQDIHCFSMCPHHFLPVEYYVDFGYISRDRALGISKLTRLAEVLAKQPLLQEDFTKNLVTIFENYIDPQGVIVQVRGRHMCMTMRGVKQENSWTLTSSISGLFKEPSVREEFALLKGNK